MLPSKWFRKVVEHAENRDVGPQMQLLWFCHAGGGPASVIRSMRQHENALSSSIGLDVCVLPGREDRFGEPARVSMSELVETLTQVVATRQSERQKGSPGGGSGKTPWGTPIASRATQVVLIGHSLGALIAYRLAQSLTAWGLPPAGLIVAAMRSPERVRPRPERLRLPDDEFADQLDREFGGIPASLRRDPAAMKLFLPILRADLQLMESFRDPEFDDFPTLNCPVAAMWGSDDPAAPGWEMQGWSGVTSNEFQLHRVEGNHFFPIARVGEVLRTSVALSSSMR